MKITIEDLAPIFKDMDINVDNITESTKISDIASDSIDQLEMVLSIEDYFDIGIDDEEASQLQTVSDVISLLEAKKNK